MSIMSICDEVMRLFVQSMVENRDAFTLMSHACDNEACNISFVTRSIKEIEVLTLLSALSFWCASVHSLAV